MSDADSPRKPRIALMGEFSAGKSTLSNLLMGVRPLPEKVTATRLSPVWITHGTGSPYRVDIDGTTEEISLEKIEAVPVEETRYIRLEIEADLLEVCDLVDFPGISDPNMASDVWERMLSEIDAVIWCTHATQAWRQSESAVWESMPDLVKKHSILLITRFDKLTTDRDRARVVKRVSRETEGMFGGTFPVSLLQAIKAGEDQELWDASGAGPFTEHLIDTIQTLSDLTARSEIALYNINALEDIPPPTPMTITPRRVTRAVQEEAENRRPRTDASTENDAPFAPRTNRPVT
jgi:hypothetical protein